MLYAKQVSPEYQESTLFLGDEFFPDNIAVFGNRDYKEHRPDFINKVWEVLRQGELADVLENVKEWADCYKNITEAIIDYLPPERGGRYSTNAIHALKNYVIDFSSCPYSREYEILCNVLSIVTGKTWDYQMIRGCCQSDWNYIFYPVDEWTSEQIAVFETEYFNTGTEWIIHDEEEAPESPEDINGYSVYCTSWNDEGIRKEIADAAGVSPEEVIMYSFDGYKKIPVYKAV